MDALRVVLAVKELEETADLRAKVNELQHELELWRNGKELPTVGKYYHADYSLFLNHGYDEESSALRYDGKEMKDTHTFVRDGDIVTEPIDRPYPVYVFTSPLRYGNDDELGRTGWIQFKIQTHELHQIHEIDWSDAPFENMRYVDENNEMAEFGE